MDFELACNWDPALVDGIRGITPPIELFGGMPGSSVAGGRASFVAPEVSEAQVEEYIKRTHEAGHRFNFLLNASCLDNREYRKHEYAEILDHVAWVEAAGADSVTVTIPYLMQLIKRHNPNLKIYVSSWARVENVRKAQYFRDLGVDGIVISEEIARDFKTLEAIRKATEGIRLIAIANPGCLYGCPRSYYHANVMTHGSQGGHESEGFLVDHCYFSCTSEKMRNPAELVKIRWIRPEDIEDYEMVGIDALKIIDRYKTTDTLLGYLKSYMEGRYDGNLVDLLNLPKKNAFLPANIKYIVRDEYINTQHIMEFADITDFSVSEHLVLDNKKIPENFLSFFKTKDCARYDCATECGFCEMIARKALTLDEEAIKAQLGRYEELLELLESGRIYEDEPEEAGGVRMDADAVEAHERILEFVPAVFRGTASRKVMARLAGIQDASGKPSLDIQDVFDAWLAATPGPFRAKVESKIRELNPR